MGFIESVAQRVITVKIRCGQSIIVANKLSRWIDTMFKQTSPQDNVFRLRNDLFARYTIYQLPDRLGNNADD